jgi:hypothetical protein
MFYRRRLLALTAAVWLAAPGLLVSRDEPSLNNEPNLTEGQKKDFLLKANIIASKEIHTGVTHPWQLTLSDGTLTHDAHFQLVDERKTNMQFSDGKTEMNFKDTYHFNIAAYELAKLLALDDMVPVAVERKWKGNWGAIAWWIPKKWMESERVKSGVQAPDPDAWNKQMYKVRVFDELIYDTDANLTNVGITADWKIWRYDFTRAFRLYHDLRNPKDLVMCDRHLLEKLRQLDYDEVLEKTKPHLSKSEVQGLMARRDKIVAYFEKLIAQKGEGAVLY